MKRMLNRKVLAFLVPALILSGCDAPRENPLDPDNPDSQFGIIEGYVKTESVPRTALSNVTITDESGNILAQTNTSGYFKISNIQINSLQLYFEKTGYKKDTIQIIWNGQKKLTVEEYLNQIPHLDSLYIYSVVISRYSLPPLIQLVVRAKITDTDKDLDSMIVTCDAVGFTEYLSYNTNDKYYSKETYLYDMPVSTLEEMIGKEIRIFARESNGDKNEVGSGSLKRVITKAIDYIRPANYDTMSAKPLLEWYEYEAGFSFSQNIEVYSYEPDFSNVLVWQRINLSSDSVSIKIDKDLPDGNYFWVILCVDEFSNRIRSNPASFYIKNPSTMNQ